jgi:hypothetical protein
VIVELNVRRKPQHQLDRSVIEFIEEHDGPHNLLIVCYTGHGMYNDVLGRLDLSASIDPAKAWGISKDARANWSKTEEFLRSDEVDGDVLTMLDTIYASDMMKPAKAEASGDSTGSNERNTKRYELMAACGIGTTTASRGEHSFTRALIDALAELSKKYGPNSFTTFRLNQRIASDARLYDTPPILWSLTQNKRHISLAPMKPEPERDTGNKLALWQMPPARGYLKLGFALRNESMNEVQIKHLNRKLAYLLNYRILGIRKIDWLGIEPTPALSCLAFERTALIRLTLRQWKKMVIKRRETRAQWRTLNGPEPVMEKPMDLDSLPSSLTATKHRANTCDGP